MKIASMRRFFPILLGTIFEYYDVALYGFLAIPFSKLFFGALDPSVSLLETYGILALASLAKPLGALFFSHLGDKYGRKTALSYNLIGVGIPTLLIAVLPGYDVLGFWAPFCLLIFRTFQNFFLGGEFDGASLYIFEHTSPKRKCFTSSLLFLCFSLGTFLASSVVTFTLQEGMPSWSWRFAFLGGGILSLIIVYLRSFLQETPLFLNLQKESSPLSWRAFFKNMPAFFATLFIMGSVGGCFQFCFYFLGPHLTENLKLLPFLKVSEATSLGLLLYTLSFPLGGLLGDALGARRLLKISGCFLILLASFALNIPFLKNHLPIVLGASGILLGFLSPTAYVLIMDLFPKQMRYRGLSVGHTLANVIFAKNTPFLSQALFQQTGLSIAPLFYFLFLASMTLLGLLIESLKFKKTSP